MPSLAELLGENIVGKDGKKKNVADLSGPDKVVGLYFSAHWCPPCRAFTPNLAKFYEAVKGSANQDKFDIIFISSDRDEAGFKEYYGSMPWLTLDYGDRETKEKLAAEFNIRGIPTLILLDGEGNVITADGRGKVNGDPNGEGFPWK